MSQALLAFDTDRIKSYVFATDKLKEIRGASAILDELNREAMVEVVNELGGEPVYANGGSGLFIVNSDDVAKKAVMEVEKLYRERTGTASITGVWVDLPSNYKTGDNIQTEFRTLGYRLRGAKDSKPGAGALVTHPYLHFCDSCGTEYAEIEDTNETILLCASCQTKRDEDSKIKATIHRLIKDEIAYRSISKTGLWSMLIPALAKQGYPLEGYDRPDDFEVLAKLSTPGNYIGLIYADGDSMGRELEALKSEADFKEFSEAVDSSIYEAVANAISTHLQPAQKGIWPFDILLLGGDDLVMVTPANKVLEVGLTVMEQFTQLTGKKLKRDKGLNLSVGIAIAHANYPFGQLRRLAESALKFAKKEGAKRRQAGLVWEGGLLNFVVVSSANHLEFGEYYSEDLTAYAEVSDEGSKKPRTLFRTLRPYNAASFRKLLEIARSNSIAKAPRGKLQQLRQAIFQSKNQAMIDGLTILFHWQNKNQREAIQKAVLDCTPRNGNNLPEHGLMFPWYQTGSKSNPEFYTPLLDLIEIFDFVSPSYREEVDD